jgi:small-conductance mechanosensitive channel
MTFVRALWVLLALGLCQALTLAAFAQEAGQEAGEDGAGDGGGDGAGEPMPDPAPAPGQAPPSGEVPAPAVNDLGNVIVEAPVEDAGGGGAADLTPADVTPADPTPAETELSGAVPAEPGAPPPGGPTLVPITPAPFVSVGIDYDAWEAVASRAEGVVERGQGSAFVLRRLRADMVEWRDLFLAEQSVNARRIQTVTGQMAALGPAPADGEPPEAESVTARRGALEAQLADLRAPVRLAEEAHARADGLVREIDVLLRAQKRAQLMERGPSPLNPMLWAEVATEVSARVTGLWKELRVSLTSEARHAVFAGSWPWVIVYLALAWALFMRGSRAVVGIAGALTRDYPRGAPIWRFVASLGEVVLPVGGVLAFVTALDASGMFGFRATRIIATLPISALFYFAARWLAQQVFGPDAPDGLPLDTMPKERQHARRLVIWMGVVLAVLVPTEVLIDTGDVSPDARAAFLLPFEVALAVILFRFGKLLSARRPPMTGETGAHEVTMLRRQVIYLSGRLIMLGSLVAPVLSVMGFGLAAQAVLFPTVLTLALFGVVLLLQIMLAEVYAFVTRDEAVKRDSLVPLLGGFGIMLLAAPVAALIWGARLEDLQEIWTRFRDGYSIGDTRISPTDLATFLIIFGVGFALTRLVQGVLRASILPKTRLDIGAQNAIVSGLGYVGIFLAAMVAISTTGLNLSNVAIVAGALSVGIGFGLQTIVSNFVSGIILLIERPISEGDWIEVGGRMGYVRDISVRATRIETFDRTDVIVPNADLVSGQVVNWTRGNLIGRVIVAVSVVYGTDTQKVQALLQEIAEAHPMVLLTPPPAVVLVGFGPDVLNYEIRAIVRDVNFGLSVRSDMNRAIADRFFAEGIEIAGMARANASPGRSALNPVVAEDGEEPAAEPTLAQQYTHKTQTRDGR